MMAGLAIIIPVMRKSSIATVVSHYSPLIGSIVERVVVVDFDSNYTEMQIASWPSEVKRVHVMGEQVFNKSLALNIGYWFSSEFMLFCDADVLIDGPCISDWIDGLLQYGGKVAFTPISIVESSSGETRAAPGIVATSKTVFESVSGYRSDFEGWGLEDRDFLLRLQISGIQVINSGSGIHITHSDEERTGNYSDRDRFRTREKNLFRMKESESGIRTGTLNADLEAFDWQDFKNGITCLHRR